MPKVNRATDTLISLIVPCFNEAEVLPLLHERIQQAAHDWEFDYEVILIDDGSSDETWELMQRFHEEDPRWKIIRDDPRVDALIERLRYPA